jgi:hypothetical protein
MNSHQRRVRAVELTLTPREVVLVWLRNAFQAGTLEELVRVRHSPPDRIAVANAVYDTVRNSMKGQPEPLVERAIRQAQREADLLYLLVIYANMAVLEERGAPKARALLLVGLRAGPDGRGGVVHISAAPTCGRRDAVPKPAGWGRKPGDRK